MSMWNRPRPCRPGEPVVIGPALARLQAQRAQQAPRAPQVQQVRQVRRAAPTAVRQQRDAECANASMARAPTTNGRGSSRDDQSSNRRCNVGGPEAGRPEGRGNPRSRPHAQQGGVLVRSTPVASSGHGGVDSGVGVDSEVGGGGRSATNGRHGEDTVQRAHEDSHGHSLRGGQRNQENAELRRAAGKYAANHRPDRRHNPRTAGTSSSSDVPGAHAAPGTSTVPSSAAHGYAAHGFAGSVVHGTAREYAAPRSDSGAAGRVAAGFAATGAIAKSGGVVGSGAAGAMLDADVSRCRTQAHVRSACSTHTLTDQLLSLCQQTQSRVGPGPRRPPRAGKRKRATNRATDVLGQTAVFRPVAPPLGAACVAPPLGSAPVAPPLGSVPVAPPLGSVPVAPVAPRLGPKAPGPKARTQSGPIAAAQAGTRVLPTLFFNIPTLTTLMQTFVPRGLKPCPIHGLVTGQSGSGKSWALGQVSKYWAKCTSPAHVFTTDDFETAVRTGVPLPADPHVLLALDDVDSMGPKALAALRALMKRRHSGARLLLAMCDVYREPRHRFLLAAAHKTQLYRTTYTGPLRQFVKSLNLSPAPPDAFLNLAISRSGGNLHRLVGMLKAHRKGQTLVAGSDDSNVWQEERLFRAGKLDAAPTEKCALMVCFNSYDNVPPSDSDSMDVTVLGVLAQLHSRHSASLALRDPWLFHVADLHLLGQQHDMPLLYFHLTTKQAHLKSFLPLMTRFFRSWGCDTAGMSSVEERVDVFCTYWVSHEKRLRLDQVEAMRLFTVSGTDSAFLRTLDEMMSTRRAAMTVRQRVQTAPTATLKFLLG